MTYPKRIQREQATDWQMPDGAVYVGEGTHWESPVAVDELSIFYNSNTGERRTFFPRTPEHCVEAFRLFAEADAANVRDGLAGRDLVCDCPLDQPCHADVLLEVANDVRQLPEESK